MSIEKPRILLSAEEIDRRTAELAAAIERDYADSERLLVIGVLKGSIVFLVDLMKKLDLPLQVDFLQAASYGDSTEPGEVHILKDVDLPVRGADVLLVEDIVDTGHTLSTVLRMMSFRGARSVKLCALLDKEARRETEVTIDYRGFTIDDHFVVGYGLDYAERYRNLPYVGILEADET
ncbi:MAG: hypoxanthine phosphoribosyltransferase [Acidobacteriota bacterium]